MKTRIFGLCLILMFVHFPLTPTGPYSAHAQTTNDAPYLYYFSDDLNAWVIERADGTDRRLLGQGLVTKDPDGYSVLVDGPGWSPSGEWFAWNATTVRAGPGAIGNFRGFLVSADDTQKSDLLWDMKNVRMAWSPTEDLLLASAHYVVLDSLASVEQSFTGEVVFQVRLIDPNQPKPIAEIEQNIPYDQTVRPPNAPIVTWVQDGKYAVVETHSDDNFDPVHPSEFIVVGRDGMITTQDVNDVIYPSRYRDYPVEQTPVSPQGNVVTWDGTEYVLKNLATETSHLLGNLIPYDSVDQPTIQWSPDGSFGLVVGESAFFITIDADSVHATALPRDILPLLPSRTHFFNYYDFPTPSLWSPAGTHFLFQAVDGGLYHFDTTKQDMEILIDGVSQDGVLWQWVDEDHVLIAKDFYDTLSEERFYLYDLRNPASPEEAFKLENTSGYRYATLSPNGQYMAYMLDGPVIYDRELQQTLYIRPDVDSYFSISGGEIRWSEDSQWLLIFDNALVAGGGGMQHLGVVQADGQFRRDLSFTPIPRPITLDWLPKYIDLATLPPATSDTSESIPVQHLAGVDWIWTLSWSLDGQKLAGYLGSKGLIIWDIDSQEISRQPAEGHIETGNGWVMEWQQTQNGYIPVVVKNPDLQAVDNSYPVGVSPDGQVIIKLDENRDYAAIDVESGQILAVLTSDHNYLNSVSFSPNGRYLAVSHLFRPAVIWDTMTWQIVHTMQHPSLAVAFSPDSQYLAVGVSWDVEIWRVSDLIKQ